MRRWEDRAWPDLGGLDHEVGLIPVGTIDCAFVRVAVASALLKKNCVPYCSALFKVTSAMVASTSTCGGMTSSLRIAPSTLL